MATKVTIPMATKRSLAVLASYEIWACLALTLQIAKFEFFIVKEILKPIRSSNSLLTLEPIRMSLPKSDLGNIIYHMCSGKGVGLQKCQNTVIKSAGTNK